MKSRILALVMAALTGVGLLVTPASPAFAASGGGCNYIKVTVLAEWYTCISAPAPGYARPDAYIHLFATHPPCTFQMSIWKSPNIRIWTNGQTACPGPGEWTGYEANGPFYLGNGVYRTGFEFFYSGTSTQGYSPWLTLP